MGRRETRCTRMWYTSALLSPSFHKVRCLSSPEASSDHVVPECLHKTIRLPRIPSRFFCRHWIFCRSMGTLERGVPYPIVLPLHLAPKAKVSVPELPKSLHQNGLKRACTSVIWYYKKHIYVYIYTYWFLFPDLARAPKTYCNFLSNKGARCIFYFNC